VRGCCVIPLLLAAGVLGGAGWAAAGRVMPGIAVAMAAVAGSPGADWRGGAPAADGCAGVAGCSCGDHTRENGAVAEPAERISVRSPV
jgi:mercuric ion transport protein